MSLGSIYNWIERKYPYFTKNDATQGYVYISYCLYVFLDFPSLSMALKNYKCAVYFIFI